MCKLWNKTWKYLKIEMSTLWGGSRCKYASSSSSGPTRLRSFWIFFLSSNSLYNSRHTNRSFYDVKLVSNQWTCTWRDYRIISEANICVLSCNNAIMTLTWSSICHFLHKVATIALSPGKGTPACHSVHFVALLFPLHAGAIHSAAFAGRRLVMMLELPLQELSSAPITP